MISGQLAEISSVTFDGSFAWIGPEIKENVVQMNMMGKNSWIRPASCVGFVVRKKKRDKKKIVLVLLLSVLKKK